MLMFYVNIFAKIQLISSIQISLTSVNVDLALNAMENGFDPIIFLSETLIIYPLSNTYFS